MRWRSWLRPRPAPVATPPAATCWDAVIDLDPGALPAAATARLCADVRAGVECLPGAGWVSVEVHPVPRPTAVRLFVAGTGESPGDGCWPARHDAVLAAVRDALAGSRPAPAHDPAPLRFATPAPPEPAGFGEAPLAQLAALEGLAALASLARPSRPPPLPVPGTRAEAELLARLLAFVLPGDGAGEAAAALRRFGGFADVLAAPEAELREVPGLGTHSVAAVKLVHQAALRLARAGVSASPVLDSRDRLHAYLSAVLARERIEQFRVLFLDARGLLRADEVQGTGTVNHTPVYPREVVRRALELDARAVVLVHNHPSGDPTPSDDDIRMTAQVQDAARTLGIEVRDHVIVGAGRFTSLAESRLM